MTASSRFRRATSDDATLVARLVDALELAIDPQAVVCGLDQANEFIDGWFDESETDLVLADDDVEGFLTLQVDRGRGRTYAEIYLQPDAPMWADVVAEVRRRSAKYNQPLWLLFNTRNVVMRDIVESLGGSHLTTSWLMARPLSGDSMPTVPEDVRIRRAESEADRRVCHDIYEDAFAQHFGYVPRTYEQWIEPFHRSPSTDPQGMALLEVDGVAEGFIECDNSLAHDRAGHVGLLGVRHRSHKLGFGRLLLQWAFAHSAAQGFSRIELSVDTGNQSGALALYESLGFAVIGGWETWQASSRE